MNSDLVPHQKPDIPEEVMVAVLNRCDETREFIAQMWLQNPKLAKQGGSMAAALISEQITVHQKSA